MGDANRHSNDNLPAMLAAGRFRHGQHLAFDQQNNTPLANLQVTLIKQLGIESEQFSPGTGTLTGLETYG